jgi:hypothetical protein
MSLPFRLFPGGTPAVDSDKLLISRADATSPTGFSNYIVTWGELKATLSHAVPGIDGADGEDGMTVLGVAGRDGAAGTAGAAGRNGISIPGLDGADAEEPLVVPGPRGIAGAAGANGTIGRDGIGVPGMDGADADEPVVIPGARGAAGAAGPAGSNSVTTSMFVVDAEVEEAILVPGPRGATGATGPSGGGGGAGNTWTAVLDFGAFPGSTDASVVITGQAAILTTSIVIPVPQPTASVDHSAMEHVVDPPVLRIGNIVAGTGFTVYGFTNNNRRHYGTYNVAGTWS